MRKTVSIFLAFALMVGTAVSLVGCGSVKTLQIDLNDYVSFELTGAECQGKIQYIFMDSFFEDDFGDDLVFKSGDNKGERAVDDFIDDVRQCGTFSQDSDLSNGDLIQFKWTVDTKALESEYNVSINSPKYEMTVEGLEEPYVDILSLECDKDGETIPVNSGESIIFTAEVDTNINIDTDIVLCSDSNNDDLETYHMNDDGVNGDETANDGIYSVTVHNDYKNAGVRLFYVDVNGTQSDTVVDIILEDPDAEDTEETEVSREPEETEETEDVEETESETEETEETDLPMVSMYSDSSEEDE